MSHGQEQALLRFASCISHVPLSAAVSKRVFDIFFSGLGLIALAPLLLGIALYVRLDSPGPILFLQRRVGRGGRLFHIHKFRTMRAADGNSGPLITADADARITRAGRWLRASKLDELPQLWNVLRGDMSLVGPRPEVERYVNCYPPEIRTLVLSVRPGITDPASLRFRNEGALLAASADPERTYIETILPAKLALSVEYVRSANLLTDIRLILATVFMPGAGRS